jgi:serine phosphatase RsbU (regulator of sigma subunit)
MLQFLLAAGVIAFLLVRGGQQAVDEVLAEMRQEVLERVYEHLSFQLNEPVQLNRLHAAAWNTGALKLTDSVSREHHFYNHLRVFPEAAMTFVGLPDGSFYGSRRTRAGDFQVVRNNESTGGDSWYYAVSTQGLAGERKEIFRKFDPRSRPWYKSAQEFGAPTFSGVYRHFVFPEPTITAAHPVFDETGKLAGVFGVDYLLSGLSEMLRAIPVGASGQVFITDAEGYLVAASAIRELFVAKEGRIERVRATEAANPVLRQAASGIPKQESIASREIVQDGRSYMIDSREFRENGLDWRIHVVLASDDYLGGLAKAVTRTIIVMIFAILLVFLTAVATAAWVVRPILRLNTAAGALAKGQLNEVPDTQRQDELGQLARSFNAMAVQITDFVERLESKVAERTQELAAKTEAEQQARQALHKELEKAGHEQRMMLPPAIELPQLTVQLIYQPSSMVSGDFCSYRWRQEGNVLFGYLIDVTGHGAATALRTAAMNVLMQESLLSREPLLTRMFELNRRVEAYFQDDVLIAACCFEIDLQQRELRYVAAGVTEFFADAAAVKGRIMTPGSLLGLSKEPDFLLYRTPIQTGDLFCIYSDGVGDRLNEGEQLPQGGSLPTLLSAVKKLAAIGVCHDDVTALCIRIGE